MQVLDQQADAPASEVGIDLRDGRHLRVSIQSPSGRWSHRLSPRHAELLLLLAVSPNGLTSAELSQELYSSGEHVVAIRAEISRLRKHLGGVLEQRPYRFADWADVTVTGPASATDLLPASTAPTIRAPPQRTAARTSRPSDPRHSRHPFNPPAQPSKGAAMTATLQSTATHCHHEWLSDFETA